MQQRTAQEVFSRLNEIKKELREQRDELKERFFADSRYAENEEYLRKGKDKKKQLADELKAVHPDLVDKIEQLREDLKSEKEIFTDMMVTQMLKGESTELKDQHEQLCFPIFSVKMQPEKLV